IQSAPSPTGATLSELSGVSCPAVKVCAAVGDYEDRLGHPVTLAERWNGTAWAAQPTPDPGGDGNFARLTAVSCASANACTAVGDYSDRSGSTVPLAERWNGTSWTLQSTPLPGGAANAQLLSVSCPAMSACTAVGQYDDGAGLTKTLAERWGGSAWTVQSTPNPAGTEISRLSGVSCVSTTACTAVGAASETLFSGGSTLVESWNGTTWAIHSSPTPVGAIFPALFGVSCPSATACTAVGYYQNSAGVTVTLAEHWNGSTWVRQGTKNPSSGSVISGLDGVSCHYEIGCTAGGLYGDGTK